MPRIVAIAVVSLVLAAGLSACGGDDEETADTTVATTATTPTTPTTEVTSTTTTEPAGTSVEEWGADLCGALIEWNDGLETIAGDFEDEVGDVDGTDISVVRDLLTSFFGDAADRTHDLGDDLEALGEPDIDEGGDIATEVRQAVSKVQGELTSLRNKVADISGDIEPQAFSDEVDELNTEFQDNVDEIATTFDDFEGRYGEDGAAVDDVFATDPACAEVGA